MEKKKAAIIIVLLLAIMAAACIISDANTAVMSLCVMALCLFVAVDSVADYLRRRPKGKRAVYQLCLTVAGCCTVICYLAYTLCH